MVIDFGSLAVGFVLGVLAMFVLAAYNTVRRMRPPRG